MELGERLRELRETAGLSLSQVEAASGVLASNWSAYETGRRSNPKLGQLQKMADGLGVSLRDLLKGVCARCTD